MTLAITDRKPIELAIRIATAGTPRPFRRTIHCGASPRRASAKFIREATYNPEFRHESTAVSTIAFMTCAAAGMPISSSVEANGDLPSSAEFQGRMATIRNTEST